MGITFITRVGLINVISLILIFRKDLSLYYDFFIILITGLIHNLGAPNTRGMYKTKKNVCIHRLC